MHYLCCLIKFNVLFFKYVLFVLSILWFNRQVECTEWLVDFSCISRALVYGTMQNCTTSCLLANVQVVTMFVRTEYSSNWDTNPSTWKDMLCIFWRNFAWWEGTFLLYFSALWCLNGYILIACTKIQIKV